MLLFPLSFSSFPKSNDRILYCISHGADLIIGLYDFFCKGIAVY